MFEDMEEDITKIVHAQFNTTLVRVEIDITQRGNRAIITLFDECIITLTYVTKDDAFIHNLNLDCDPHDWIGNVVEHVQEICKAVVTRARYGK